MSLRGLQRLEDVRNIVSGDRRRATISSSRAACQSRADPDCCQGVHHRLVRQRRRIGLVVETGSADAACAAHRFGSGDLDDRSRIEDGSPRSQKAHPELRQGREGAGVLKVMSRWASTVLSRCPGLRGHRHQPILGRRRLHRHHLRIDGVGRRREDRAAPRRGVREPRPAPIDIGSAWPGEGGLPSSTRTVFKLRHATRDIPGRSASAVLDIPVSIDEVGRWLFSTRRWLRVDEAA